MSSWKRAITLGFVSWLIPFAVAFIAFPLRESMRPLFESIMAVTVPVTAVGLGLAYFRRVRHITVREGLLLGLVWFGLCLLIDAPLMLFGGPMQMSVTEYMADIGLTYASIPAVTLGLAIAASRIPARP